jgi:hypothetical protein
MKVPLQIITRDQETLGYDVSALRELLYSNIIR